MMPSLDSLWGRVLYRMGLACLGVAIFYVCGLFGTLSVVKPTVFLLMVSMGGIAWLESWGRTRAASRIWLGFTAVFFTSAAVKGFLFLMYGMSPKDTLVVDALAGTTVSEVGEFVGTYWRTLLLIAVAWALAWAPLAGLERLLAGPAGRRAAARRAVALRMSRASKWRDRCVTTFLFLLVAGLHANPTVAGQNPFVYWPRQYVLYQAHQQHMEAIALMMAQQEKDVSDDPVSYRGPASNTVVLVLGESVNRANWSLYGYPRATTPRLDKLRDDLLVFQDVISADAATAQSLLKMLTPATVEHPELWAKQPSILALAKRAGYKVTWLSNQERSDGWIQLLAGQADEQVFVNKGSGRSITSLDEQLIPELDKALQDPAPLQFIVVHMQGAHLRYDLRFPQAFKKFDSQTQDAVSRSPVLASRSFWIRNARNDYDNAMLYGDYVLAEFLRLAEERVGHAPAQLLYVSDHGQEVGHTRNFAGHSKRDRSGYEIPVFLWSGLDSPTMAPVSSHVERRAYQADRLDNTLLSLLKISTDYYDARDDLLSPNFRPVKRMQGAISYERAPVLN